jgi:hypothetical protein
MKYRDRTRKTVTLPSGAVAVVVRLAPIHFIELGDIPIASLGEDRKDPREKTARSVAPNIKFQNLVIKNCVLSFEYQGEKFKLVDKPIGSEEDGELSIHELEPADVEAIQRAVSSFDEGRLPERANTFPEGSEPGRTTPLNGEGLRHPADAVDVAPVG